MINNLITLVKDFNIKLYYFISRLRFNTINYVLINDNIVSNILYIILVFVLFFAFVLTNILMRFINY